MTESYIALLNHSSITPKRFFWILPGGKGEAEPIPKRSSSGLLGCLPVWSQYTPSEALSPSRPVSPPFGFAQLPPLLRLPTVGALHAPGAAVEPLPRPPGAFLYGVL